jgi:HAD superfamily hydrolase (TIGR01459 family)
MNLTDNFSALAPGYDAVLSDVWGVLHNGIAAFPESGDALVRFRRQGGTVVLISNAPRPGDFVARMLDNMRVPREAYDDIVTSGDVTRDYVAGRPGARILHIGPERDHGIFEGLDAPIVPLESADYVICTGLFDDDTETPDDYADMLRRMRARNLPFICANPDIVVEKGERLIWCAGALARDYAQLGGRTFIAGKPHRPIYVAALKAASEVLGREIANRDALAIGDGVLTDVKGAEQNGVDILYVSGGIHARDYGETLDPDPALLAAFLEKHGHHPVAVIPRLR